MGAILHFRTRVVFFLSLWIFVIVAFFTIYYYRDSSLSLGNNSIERNKNEESNNRSNKQQQQQQQHNLDKINKNNNNNNDDNNNNNNDNNNNNIEHPIIQQPERPTIITSLIEFKDVEVLIYKEFTINPEEKFMTYFTHSGYYNQLSALKNALLLAKLLGRTLLLPPALLGPPIPWGKYPKLYERLLTTTKTGLEHCKKISRDFQLPAECLNYFDHTKVSWDFLLNMEPLRKWHPIIDRWEQSYEWLEQNLNINRINDIYSIKDNTLYDYCIYDSPPPMSKEAAYSATKYKRKIDLNSLAKIKKKIIHFGSLFGMNRIIVETPENLEYQKFIGKHSVPNNEILLKVSNNIIEQLGGMGNYIGIHIRITDGFFMKTARLTIDRIYHEIINSNTNLTPEEVDVLEGGTHEQDILVDDTVDLGENNKFNYSVQQKIISRSKPEGELNELTRKDEDELTEKDKKDEELNDFFKGELKREENDETRSSFLNSNLKCHKPLHSDSGVNTVIFIATDAKSPRTNPLLYKFFNTFPCVFVLDDFEKDLNEVKLLRNVDDKTQLAKYLIPMLDAMISAKGKEFYGTPRSTFSKYILNVLRPLYTSNASHNNTENTENTENNNNLII